MFTNKYTTTLLDGYFNDGMNFVEGCNDDDVFKLTALLEIGRKSCKINRNDSILPKEVEEQFDSFKSYLNRNNCIDRIEKENKKEEYFDLALTFVGFFIFRERR